MAAVSKNKIGLALGLGAAPGIAHIGVLKALEEKKIPINFIAGTSIGAFIGACYAKTGRVKDVEKLFVNLDWIKIAQSIDPDFSLISKGLIRGEKVKEMLKPVLGNVKFKDLKIKLAVTATDVNTGEEVVIKSGCVLDAVRASISMPVIFVPVKYKNRYLIDGGSVNPLPVDIVKKMGAKYIIASNIVPSPANRDTSRKHKKQTKRQKNEFLDNIINKSNPLVDILAKVTKKISKVHKEIDNNIPDMFSVLVQAMYSTEYRIVKERLNDADLAITSDILNVDTLDFSRAKECIDSGYRAAKKVLANHKISA